MVEQYTYKGITYNVSPDRLSDFLKKYPNAVKVSGSESEKTKSESDITPESAPSDLPIFGAEQTQEEVPFDPTKPLNIPTEVMQPDAMSLVQPPPEVSAGIFSDRTQPLGSQGIFPPYFSIKSTKRSAEDIVNDHDFYTKYALGVDPYADSDDGGVEDKARKVKSVEEYINSLAQQTNDLKTSAKEAFNPMSGAWGVDVEDAMGGIQFFSEYAKEDPEGKDLRAVFNKWYEQEVGGYMDSELVNVSSPEFPTQPGHTERREFWVGENSKYSGLNSLSTSLGIADRDALWDELWSELVEEEKEGLSMHTKSIALVDALTEADDPSKSPYQVIEDLRTDLERSHIATYSNSKNINAYQRQFGDVNSALINHYTGRVVMDDDDLKDAEKRQQDLNSILNYEYPTALIGGKLVGSTAQTPTLALKENQPLYFDYSNMEISYEKGDGNVQEVTGIYDTYLSQYRGFEISNLQRINDEALFERAGWEIEKNEIIPVYITDKSLREEFNKYKAAEPQVIDGVTHHTTESLYQYNVPLGELISASGGFGAQWTARRWEYWSPDVHTSKLVGEEIADHLGNIGGIAPVSYEDMPYENVQQFHEYLDLRQQQVEDLSIREAALWEVYYQNKDPEFIKASKGEIFTSSVYGGLGDWGEKSLRKANMEGKGKIIHDEILFNLAPDAELVLSEDQTRHLERSFLEESIEVAGGLTGMAPHLIIGNKVVAATGMMRVAANLNAAKYIINGRRLNQSRATAWAARHHPGKSLKQLEKSGLIKSSKATAWEKTGALLYGAVVEDLKMREGMMLTGGQEFDRGVGFGFSLGGQLFPFKFKPGAKAPSYAIDASTRPGMLGLKNLGGNRLNTFLDLTVKNGTSFAIAAETGDLIGAVVDEMEHSGEWQDYVEEHWGDYDKALRRYIMHCATGTFLGTTHLKKNDLKTYKGIEKFKFAAADKIKALDADMRKRAKEDGVDLTGFIVEGQQFSLEETITWANNRKSTKGKSLQELQAEGVITSAYENWKTEGYSAHPEDIANMERWTEDLMMSTSFLARCNDMEDWTDPVKGKELWKKHLKPIEDLFKEQGKNLVIEFTDQAIYQEIINDDGTKGQQEVGATYTRLDAKEGGRGTGIIRINLAKTKGRGTMGHEALHAYLDVMFDGKPELKKQFEDSFKATLSQVKVPGHLSLYDAIITDQALKGDKRLQLEEMMAYTAEYLSRVENAHLVEGKTFNDIARFFNNFSKSATGKNGDFYTGNDVIRMLADFGRTGELKSLERLNEYVDIGEGASGIGTIASKNFVDGENVMESGNEVKKNLEKEKKKLIQRQVENTKTKPENFEQVKEEITEQVAEINKQLDMLDGVLKQGDPRELINQHISRKKRDKDGKVEKDAEGKDVYESKFTKENLKTEEGKEAYEKAVQKTVGEILNSKLIENMLFEGMDFKNRESIEAEEFLADVKGRLDKKFEEYKPTKNEEVFGWLTGGGGGQGKSVIFRVKGDWIRDSKKKVKTISSEVVEGYENMYGDSGAGMSKMEGESKEVEVDRKYFTETVEYSKDQTDLMEAEVAKANVDVNQPYKSIKKLLTDQVKITNSKGKKVVPTKPSDVKATGPLKEVLRMESEHHGVPLEAVLANATIPKGKVTSGPHEGMTYRNAARTQIYKDRIANIQALPDGTSPSGEGMGMATNKFGEFLVKGQRTQMSKTGSAQGLAEQTLQLDRLKPSAENIKEYLELFGIKPDGSFVTKGEAKFDSAIKQQIIQRSATNVDQISRKQQGKPTAKIGEGRSPVMASRLFEGLTEAFPELKNKPEDALDVFHNIWMGREQDIDPRYLNHLIATGEIDVGISREQAVMLAYARAHTEAGKRTSWNFAKEFTEAPKLDITLENGAKITAEQINGINLNNVWKVVDGNVVVDTKLANERVDHMIEIAKLLDARLGPAMGGTKSFIDQVLGMHARVNFEVISKATELKRAEKGKGKIIDTNGESIVGQPFTRGSERALETLGKKSAEVDYIWDKVKSLEFKKAGSQVNAAKKASKANNEFELTKIIEEGFSELSEAAKVEVHDAIRSTMEHYVHSAKTPAEFLSRLEAVVTTLRAGTNLRLGTRQTVPIIAIKIGKDMVGSDAKVKLEHQKANSRQDNISANLIARNEWRTSGMESLKDFVGILAPKEILDIMDAKGGKVNIEALFRLATLEPSLLKEFVTIESGGKETLFDYVMREGRKELNKRTVLREAVKNDKATIKSIENKLRRNGLLGKGETVGLEMGSRTFDSHNKALELGRKRKKKAQGLSTFDFDETLIIKGENFVTATKGKETIKISSENFPIEGPRLEAEGYTFDFKDFVNVKGGKEGPLLQKLKNQISKYGNKNVFILTARMQESAPAIHQWLKSKDVDLPIENITGLGNSTGEAKARWMLEKFAEGYNDMYFVDDALPNVKAVKKVLDQLDVKSNVQQVMASRDFDADINRILEGTFNIDAAKRFSKAEGRMRGQKAQGGLGKLGALGGGRRKVILPDTAADLELLIEPLYGKGKKGKQNQEWFRENFIKPFERGMNDYNSARQRLANDYQALRKGNKDVVKDLGKEVEGTNFTHDMAMRVYIWNKAGFEVPDLAKSTQKQLVDYIRNNPKYKAYADKVAEITKHETGLKEPTEFWWSETIASELSDINRGVGRKDYISDWIDIKNEVFSEKNLNKMESQLGREWRDSIEDMFDRMETGRSRAENLSGITGDFVNYINGSVGAIMNWNTRSALLQMISAANFVNTSFNNPARAAAAFANVPQFAKDFMKIMNSDMLKQRRQGLEINVTEAEIAAAANSKGGVKALFNQFIKAGYIPTKFADSFAISLGGATYYRNAVKKYVKQGLSKAEAEAKAWIDFQAISERTQQSNRPDLISKQQTTLAGRFILPFANTPLQMTRASLKEVLDVAKGRYKNSGDAMYKLGKAGYYGFVQTLFFAGLSSGAFAFMMNSDDEEEIQKKKTRMRDTMMDSALRGMGIKGAWINGIINAVKEFDTQREKGYGADYSEVAEDLLNISPPVGAKFRQLDAAGNTYKYNRKQIDEEGFEFSLDSPSLEVATRVTEATTNIPVHRYFKKANNLKNVADSDFEVWQRVLMALGWSEWDVAPDVAKQKSKNAKEDSKKDQDKNKPKKRRHH